MEIFLLGVFPEAQFTEFAAAASQRLGIPVKYLREFQPLGTAGGLYFFRDLVSDFEVPSLTRLRVLLTRCALEP